MSEIASRTRWHRRWSVLLAVLVFGSLAPAAGDSHRSHGRFDSAGIEGSEVAVMQPFNVGVSISLVAGVPGGTEAWGVGRTTAKVPGWAGESDGGQTVFMRYTSRDGWRMTGPPTGPAGIDNPRLTALDVTRRGDGWAVGDQGAMYRLSGGRWTAAPRVTEAVLLSVSLSEDGSYGYAVGAGPTFLRLRSGQWSIDPVAVPEGERWEVGSVAAAGPEDAWAAGSVSRAVLVLRRTASGWERVRTGQPLFDEQEQPRQAGSLVVASTRAATVSAAGGSAWVGGTIVPVDVTSSIGDVAGDPTRPFVIRFGAGAPRSYCPDQYAIDAEGASTTLVCNDPFPLSGFGISSIEALPGGEVFAGGLGLFHYRKGQWFREPNVLAYLTAITFSSPTEGWVASTGDTVGGRGAVSSIATLGHWTRSPREARTARWPQPVTHPSDIISHSMEAVAVAPDGSGRAFAVGGGGATMHYTSGTGWVSLGPQSPYALHAAAWPGEHAWAVGGRGAILRFDGTRVDQDPASSQVTTASLFGVAFTSPSRGYAVGANGTILAYDGLRWALDPAARKVTDSDLFAVAAAGDEFVAVGTDGVILETRGARWRRVGGLEPLLARGGPVAEGGQMPALYTVDGLPDGSAYVGGELGTLIRRDGGRGEWKVDADGARVPPEGTIIAVAVRRDAGKAVVLASVSYDALKYSGEVPSALTGFLLHGTAEGWQDLQHDTRFTSYPAFDASAPVDPVYAIAWDGPRAWAVGGTGVGNDDGMGHVQAHPTSAVYRVDLTGDPRPPGHSTVPEFETGDGIVNFAYFGDSACGRGLCSAAIGTGTKADVIAAQIQHEINEASKLPGGPKFVVFGGNMRRTGIPEELGQFKRFLDGFRIPVYSALGNRDLFTGLEPSALDDAPDFGLGGTQNQVKPDSLFYVNLFEDRPRPWGHAPAPRGFVPVATQMTPGAHTHYAFDYSPDGKPLVRVIVLDDSAPGHLTDPSTQNPPNNQTAWVQEVLESAQSPAIVVMNRPASNPLDLTRPQSYPEAQPIQNAAAQVGASAVLTSYFRQNSVALVEVPGVAGTVPVYVMGGGGSPLETVPGNPPRAPEPSLGYYHSWQMVTVDGTRPINLLGQYRVAVRSYPVVDSVSIVAVRGTLTVKGRTLRFVGSGHAPLGGGPGDPLQSKAVVVPFTFAARGVCPPDVREKFRPRCFTTGPVGPTYTFLSEDESVGYFVRPSVGDEDFPHLDSDGNPVADPTSGLFCAVGEGVTHVRIVSGFHSARMRVVVEPGRGSCTDEPPRVLNKRVPPEPFVPAPELEPEPRPEFYRVPPGAGPVAIFPPPPAPVVAPAPPAAPGVGRKEEHELQPESEGHGDYDFTALSPRRARDAVEQTWTMLGAGLLLSFAGAACVAAVTQRRVEAARWPARRRGGG